MTELRAYLLAALAGLYTIAWRATVPTARPAPRAPSPVVVIPPGYRLASPTPAARPTRVRTRSS